jgi:histidine triad (HIT) family protein
MNCIFCDIVADPHTAAIIYQDEHSVCFLDTKPLFPGHCLLVPRTHYQTLMELPPVLLTPLMTNTQRIASAVQQAMNAQGVFVAMNNIVSQSVPHLHVHIVPRNKGDGLKGFFWPRQRYTDAVHMEEVRRKIEEALN